MALGFWWPSRPVVVASDARHATSASGFAVTGIRHQISSTWVSVDVNLHYSYTEQVEKSVQAVASSTGLRLGWSWLNRKSFASYTREWFLFLHRPHQSWWSWAWFCVHIDRHRVVDVAQERNWVGRIGRNWDAIMISVGRLGRVRAETYLWSSHSFFVCTVCKRSWKPNILSINNRQFESISRVAKCWNFIISKRKHWSVGHGKTKHLMTRKPTRRLEPLQEEEQNRRNRFRSNFSMASNVDFFESKWWVIDYFWIA